LTQVDCDWLVVAVPDGVELPGRWKGSTPRWAARRRG